MDEDDEPFDSIYENGRWEWDDSKGELNFVSDLITVEDKWENVATSVLPKVEFRIETDLLEQQRFKKRYQRKTTESDVVILQDVKDIVLYSAPVSILSPAVINVLHLPAMERFLRALILYIQYYLQILATMANRIKEGEKKIRTVLTENIERKYRDDLEDLRLLVGKEYCMLILGVDKYAKYHHMDATKSMSLSRKDAIFIDTLVRIAVQIVWITLGRRNYKKIELEVHRLFKSDVYNDVEHKLESSFRRDLSSRENFVIYGHCVRHGKKLNSRSPLLHEVFCDRPMDSQLYGLAHIKYSALCTRLQYLEKLLSEPEVNFVELGINIGILGLPREHFDIMLREIMKATNTSASMNTIKRVGSRMSRTSYSSSRKSTTTSMEPPKLFPDIYLPDKKTHNAFPKLPHGTLPHLQVDDLQRRKWLQRIMARSKKLTQRHK